MNDTPNNIVELSKDAAPSAPAANTPTPAPTPAPQQPARLNPAAAGHIAHCLAQHAELTEKLSSGLVTPDTAAQKAQLAAVEKTLSAAMLAHGRELLGAWNVVRTEYEPILRSVATVFRHTLFPFLATEEQTTTAPSPEPTK